MKKSSAYLIAIILASMAVGMLQPRANAVVTSRTYTTNADFDEGTLIGVEHDTVPDQLQLSNETTTLPFIWVPNNEGTVSKLNTSSGRELGRYWISSGGDSSPSRTTVDLLGNCWVGCRQRGTVAKIGLFEAGQWIDRNSDGICETSHDTNGDGDITGAEILPWGQDECVLYEVVLVPGFEGTYDPGTYGGPYDHQYWGVSPRGLAIDAQNNLWAGTWSTSKYFYIDGSTGAIIRRVDVAPHNAYGAAMDENGILWSAEGPGGDQSNVLLRFDPSINATSFVDIGHTCYGLGLDYKHHLWTTSYWNYKFSRIDISINPPTFVTYDAPEQIESRGVAATSDNDIWVANTGAGTVTRYSNDGVLLATITGLNGPTGVSVDANGEVWATNNYDEYVDRINPMTNTTDLFKRVIGSGGHYTYSDMTGIVARTITTRIGTWMVIFDSEAANTPWGTLSWHSLEPNGTLISVRASSSEDNVTYVGWESSSNGTDLTSTPNGRYLKIEVTLKIISGDVSPVLYDLTVQPEITADVAVVDITPESNWVYQGKLCHAGINVTVANLGETPENFTVSLYAVNETSALNYTVGTQTVTNLAPNDTLILTFVWNSSDAMPCHYYNITAVASTVPGEANTANNVKSALILIKVRIVGDINGDGTVDLRDVYQAALAFGKSPPMPGWLPWGPYADINNNGEVDIQDYYIICFNFGKTCT